MSVQQPLEATFVPHAAPGGRMLLWTRDGTGDGSLVSLSIGGEARSIRARELSGAALLDLPDGDAPTLVAWRELLRFARGLVRRGSLLPAFAEVDGMIRARWSAELDLDERTLLAALVAALPPAAVAPVADAEPRSAWRVARAFVDAVVDAAMRAETPPAVDGAGWSAELETALLGPDDRLTKTSVSQRAKASLEQWTATARQRDPARLRLVLALELPATGSSFRLSFHVESRESHRPVGPIPARAVWSDAPEAHLVADDLTPVRVALRTALQKAGRVVAPIEVALAADGPEAALLTPHEAWNVVTTLRAALETTGARVTVPSELESIESRFPRARVRIRRDDGRDANEVSLASAYRVVWEVATGDVVLDAPTLRALAPHAPVVRHGSTWLPLTTEAGERLARVAEREEAVWTGPQGLAAALAGEVRLPGDLADAAVVAEPGLLRLIDELRRDAEDVPVPAGLQASLRTYQQRGVSWLLHRTKLGLGALLADDMGLGKTVQLISLLLALRERGLDDGPTLVVCPASLVGNWERELARFAPALRVVRHHGDARTRDVEALRRNAGPHDVVLTTYGLVRRDAAMLSGLRWGTVVCDEAQNVKNPTAAQSKALRSIPSARRVALSGTPVENRLAELWSLLEFANPGLLGPLERFRREIATPIEKERDARAVRWLKAATAPFLLRRLKSDPDIAPELPEKEIIRVHCSLSEEQARLYKEAVDRSLATLDEAGSSIERSGRVLRLLTELKQVCNHPAQLTGDEGPLAGRSGKLERATEMIEEIVDSGERTLVFTQYAEMGRMLCAHFAKRLKRPVPFFHGGLSLPERESIVRTFQEASDGPPVLVLSLRAGGVGLNLTRASHVLHFDRWWNPAVEDQATDRAHRIGQTRRVQVHHLVSMGTLEEKIDRMLEEKRGLADAVVSGGEAWLTQLSTDELRALVALGSDAAVESIESLDEAG